MRWSRAALIAAVALAACQQPVEEDQGIAVGNPGLLSLSIAISDDFELNLAELDVASIDLAGCGSGDSSTWADESVDLAQEPGTFDFRAGSWCGVRVVPEGLLHVTADWAPTTGETGSVELDLQIGVVDLGVIDDDIVVDEESELAFELAAPGWLDAAVLGLVDGQDLVVGAEDDLHAVLVAALQDDSALYDDLDGSGAVDPPERAGGPLATAEIEVSFITTGADAAAGYESACTCNAATHEVGAAGLALLLGLAALRRRLRGPRY